MNVFERRARLVRELEQAEADESRALRDGIAETIARLRKAKKWTQEDLAIAAGCLRSTVANIESRGQGTTLENLCRLAAALDVQPWEMLREVLEKKS